MSDVLQRNALAGPEQQRDWIDSIFLGGLSLAERAGFGGTPLKLYNDVVQRGRTEPITERDFSRDELNAYRDMVLSKYLQTGNPTGAIDYPDYRGVPVPQGNLGGFRYNVAPDQGVTISDTYDFNTNRAGAYDRNALVRLLASVVAPYRAAAGIGRITKPPGTGVPVQLNIQPGHSSLADLLRQYDNTP